MYALLRQLLCERAVNDYGDMIDTDLGKKVAYIIENIMIVNI